MNGRVVSAIRLNQDLPEKIEGLLQKALDKDRSLRYQSAAEMRTDLMRLKREVDSGSNPSSFTGIPAADSRPSGSVAAAASSPSASASGAAAPTSATVSARGSPAG